MLPSLTAVFMLMFDDVALISDTVVGFQKQLNILHQFSMNSKLNVNIGKTKIMIFKRGGKLSRKEKWFYDNNVTKVVNEFS